MGGWRSEVKVPWRFAPWCLIALLLTAGLLARDPSPGSIASANGVCAEAKVASYETGDLGRTILSPYFLYAESFRPSQSATLTTVRLDLYIPSTPTAPITVEVRQDDGNGKPGAVLASTSVTPSSNADFTFIPFTLSPALTLTAGTTYYVAAGSMDNTQAYNLSLIHI